MTEEQLIAAGFKKQEANHLETGNGYDYYYYILDLTEGITLMSSSNDEFNNDFWIVKSFDIPELYIENSDLLVTFINTVNKVLK
jgi:hypothetical protein